MPLWEPQVLGWPPLGKDSEVSLGSPWVRQNKLRIAWVQSEKNEKNTSSILRSKDGSCPLSLA